jgi:MoaA/NifB/PqqE/SkfB family radical SAM enzyme
MNLDSVVLLNLEITSHCNLQCPQCSRTDEDGNIPEYVKLAHWDAEPILANLELERLKNLKYVHLEGDTGDAIMHPQLEKILDAFYELPQQPMISLWTNGGVRSQEWWANLAKRYHDRLKVQFSIDGLEDTNHLYRVGSNYKKTIDNARSFINAGGKAAQRCIVFHHNEHQVQEIAKTSQTIGFGELHFIPNDESRFRGLDKWPVFVKKQFSHEIENTGIKNVSQYDYNTFPRTWSQDVSFRPISYSDTCPSLKSGSLNITYQGHVIPCCLYNADLYFDHQFNEKFKELVGDLDKVDLHKTKLSDILAYGYFDRLNNMLKSGDDPGRCQSMCGKQIRFNKKTVYFIPATQRN